MNSPLQVVPSDSQSTVEAATVSERSKFKQLTVYKDGLVNLNLCQAGTETPIFHVVCSNWRPSAPNVTLHAGSDAKGPIKGVVHMRNAAGHYKVGLGDPEGGAGIGNVQWENFDRVQTWNPKHRFCCEVQGERRWFLWRKPGGFWERVGDLELVEDGEVGKDATAPGSDDREILVKYSRPKTAFGKKRGTFEIKEGMDEDWQLMALLTGMALVVLFRRHKGK